MKPPTTDDLAKFLKLGQPETIKVLNDLALLGYLTKERRLSAGPSGYGYDGSLYSEVHPTERTLELLQSSGGGGAER